MNRRGLLSRAGTAATVGIAGCLGVFGDDEGEAGTVEFQLQSDRIYRERPVRTADGLVLTFTYAVADTAYRYDAGSGDERMLFPTNGWFLKTTVNWVWEGPIPDGWRLDPDSLRLVVGGEYFEPLSALPRDISWDAVQGPPASIRPQFADGALPDWTARQGLVNFLFDTRDDPGATYYLEWDPPAPVDGSTEPVFLTSTYGPFERGAASETAETEST
jgi:hypothetical protein